MVRANFISIRLAALVCAATSCSGSQPRARPGAAPTALTCPAPQTGSSCALGTVWARDDASGLCCEYDRPCAASYGATTYATAAECNPLGCSCDRSAAAPPQPIGCSCKGSGCPTLSDLIKTGCSIDGLAIVERHGCGKVELTLSGGFTGSVSVFDEASGTLLGRALDSDVEYGVCSIFEYTFGEQFDCTDIASECSHCAASTAPGSPPACPD